MKKGILTSLTIEELENKIKEIQEELNKLKEEKKVTKRWRCISGKIYWYIDDCFNIKSTPEFQHQEDTYRYDIGNYFETENQAKAHRDKLLIYKELKDLALELNDGEKIDWNNDFQIKYSIYYDNDDDEFKQGEGVFLQELGQISCLKENFLDVALERIGEDNLRKLSKEEQ